MISNISAFRTLEFRIFYAEPYFENDLSSEIKWHRKNLSKLKKQAENPEIFFKKLGRVDETAKEYFQEQVIDSIPFYSKILEDHEKRFNTIVSLMPKRTYQKIMKISRNIGGTPEYLVFERKKGNFFFVVENMTKQRQEWVNLIKKKKICNVLALNH